MTQGGKLYSVGTLTGKAKGTKKVTKQNVRSRPRSPTTPRAAPASPARSRRCRCRAARRTLLILSLVLGPINLNLLGLSVRTNQINLRIDAVQGAGNLLGNLLCGITGILDPITRHGGQHTAGPARPDPQRASRAQSANR